MKLKQYLTESEAGINEILDMLEKDCLPFIKEMRKISPDILICRGSRKSIENIRKIKRRKDREPTDTPEWAQYILDEAFEDKFGWRARSEGVFASDYGVADKYGNSYIFFPIGKYSYLWSSVTKDLWYKVDSFVSKYENINGMETLDILYNFEYPIVDKIKAEIEERYEDTYKEDSEDYGLWVSGNDEWETWSDYEDWLEEKGYEKSVPEPHWVPHEELDDFMYQVAEEYSDELRENIRKKIENDIYNLVKSLRYEDKNLKKWINKYESHEIMFNCDEYYLINSRYQNEILDWINGESDPRKDLITTIEKKYNKWKKLSDKHIDDVYYSVTYTLMKPNKREFIKNVKKIRPKLISDDIITTIYLNQGRPSLTNIHGLLNKRVGKGYIFNIVDSIRSGNPLEYPVLVYYKSDTILFPIQPLTDYDKLIIFLMKIFKIEKPMGIFVDLANFGIL